MGQREGSVIVTESFLFFPGPRGPRLAASFRRLAALVWILLLGGCNALEPSAANTPLDPLWLQEQDRHFRQEFSAVPSPPSEALLMSASQAGFALAWLDQDEEGVSLWWRADPQSEAEKLAHRPLAQGFFHVSLAPGGEAILTLRADPGVEDPREQAVLELWAPGGVQQTISSQASSDFEPSWLSPTRFLFAEAGPDWLQVLEQDRTTGHRSQQFASPSRYPRVSIQRLYPDGWVAYDRNRPQDTHVWIASRLGEPWQERLLAGRQVRLWGWHRDRLVASERVASGRTQTLRLALDSWPLAPEATELRGDLIGNQGNIDFGCLGPDHLYALEPQSWGHQLTAWNLTTRQSRTIALPFEPVHGRKIKYSSAEAATLTLEGPFHPPSAFRLDLKSGRIDPLLVRPLEPPLEEPVEVTISGQAITLAPRSSTTTSPLLLESYGAFRQFLFPIFDEARLAWWRRGGRATLLQLEAPSQAHEHAVQQLLSYVDSLTPRPPIAYRGSSFGATLGLMAMLEQPKAFQAVWADAGLTDLLTYPQLPPGELWKSELGDPSQPKQAQRLRALSPLHRLQGQTLPPCLLTTALDDPAVDPRHTTAFLRQARLRNPDWDLSFMLQTSGVHRVFSTPPQELEQAIAFLWKRVRSPR